ncbi:hypothetical protein IPA_02675 [Ignicoccus pacificus DSM 13166]|uniref:Uncharacterized protein n=1 Tax=Ignicoccus pacificus DSM 13166 TaxID=940294 RepID=A0A977KAR6_9CREN|nr:hypothetical protein IPA_02675 [Ignicoccus pacificus DSM 13166]
MDALFDAIRRELEIGDLVSLSASQWEEIVSSYRKFATRCSESTLRDACIRRLERYKDLFKQLFKLRVYKALDREGVSEDSIDSPLLRLILKLVEDYVSTLDEVIADERGKVYAIIKRRIQVGKVVLEPGELVLMDLMEAIALSSFGYVELLRLPSETSKGYSWMRAERVHTE